MFCFVFVAQVIVIRNAVKADELISDEDYGDAMADMRSEFERFGKVESMSIPRPGVSPGEIGMCFEGCLSIFFNEILYHIF